VKVRHPGVVVAEFDLERETGLGGDVPGEPDRTGVNCRSENSHLHLLSGPDEGPESTGEQGPRNSVTRPSTGEDTNDPILVRLVALREHWQCARDHKVMRRGLLDLLQALDE
jgi:hypothetical protein